MSDASLFLNLFQGSDQSHYRTVLTGKVTAGGKHDARCLHQPIPLNEALATSHLAGEPNMGVAQVPINSENKVKWGAIDVDRYQGMDLAEFTRNCHTSGLPVVVCRSKSGGPHVYLFVKDWVPAQSMMEKLRSLAAFLAFADSEVFPKQASLAPGDHGSGINLPYYGGSRNLRYGLNDEGTALLTFQEFYEYAQTKVVTVETFEALNFRPPPESIILPDGPPCLNRLLSQRPTENRNIILANVASYLKRAHPEEWEAKLEEINRTHFAEPLPSREVEAIKKSYSKKDYEYQCRTQPLTSVCDALVCRSCRFGVGFQEVIVLSGTTIKINTSPPTWTVSIVTGTQDVYQLSLTAEELQNQRLYQRKCMEVLNCLPPLKNTKEWDQAVRDIIGKATVIDVGVENTPTGQFIELTQDFLLNRASTESFEDILRGLPFKNASGYHFRARDLWRYLESQRFTSLKQHEMIRVLTSNMKGKRIFKVTKEKGMNLILLPLNFHETAKLTPAEFDQDY
jgi:hypothetical protein